MNVDVSASAEAIDAGRATANLSAYLGGARATAIAWLFALTSGRLSAR